MPRKPMDPFARKMLQGTFVYGAVMIVMFAVLTVVYLHTRPRCSDRQVAEAVSPNAHWIATLLERRCGEDKPFLAHVNLRPAGGDIQRGFFSGSATDGEVFLVEQDAVGAGVTLEWTGPDALAIHCPGCNPAFLRKQEQQWRSVTIESVVPGATPTR